MNDVPRHEHAPKGEWTKFIVLALILLGTIVVIALLRPLIFGRIVPAVLGENIQQPTTTPIDSSEDSTPPEETTEDTEETIDEEESNQSTENEESETPDDTESEEAIAEEEAEETKIHIVSTGQTILQISRLYGVTVDQIVSANNLANPNVVRVGQELIIPNE